MRPITKRIANIPALVMGLLSLWACGREAGPEADLIIANGVIYTVHAGQPQAEALAIKDDTLLAVGPAEEVAAYRGPQTEVIDLEGRFAMPGFIEGHGHFSGLGLSLIELNFLGVESWQKILGMVADQAVQTPSGAWIVGRGWHQEKWTVEPQHSLNGYPHHRSLSELTPEHPVMLIHASGHSLFANEKAMELAGVSEETADPAGGEIVRDATGKPTGVFEERAMGLIREAYQQYQNSLGEAQRKAQWQKGIALAQKECLAKGITSFQDAGSKFYELDAYREMAERGELDLRLWAMVRHSADAMRGKLADYRWIGLGNDHLTVRAIKSEVDGALGAYGAWLLEPYNDKPGFVGQNTTPLKEVERIAGLAVAHDMQLCVHAIGDRANRLVLDLFERSFEQHGPGKDRRWRVEHAQHLAASDIERMARLNAIASMQAIHCTSDAPFVVKRLGEERAREGAYAWRSLLDAGAVVTNGTDAPVEDVDPIASFYASVTRRRPDNGLVFFPEQAMTRQEALYSYTMANAYAAFEEDLKGSLEPGKLADLVVLSQNLLTCPEEDILKTRVDMTFVGGELKYSRVQK